MRSKIYLRVLCLWEARTRGRQDGRVTLHQIVIPFSQGPHPRSISTPLSRFHRLVDGQRNRICSQATLRNEGSEDSNSGPCLGARATSTKEQFGPISHFPKCFSGSLTISLTLLDIARVT